MRREIACALAALLACASAAADEPPALPPSLPPSLTETDRAALDLTTAPADAAALAPGLRIELGQQRLDWRGNATAATPAFAWREALDYRRDWSAGRWRFTFSDRLEAAQFPGRARADETTNALREASASLDAGAGVFLDAGRINQRQGVGYGWNPSDFLRRYAIVTRTTQDPASLRENRLGTAMVRTQWLGAIGSVQAAAIPRLSDRSTLDRADFAPGFERTNRRAAALIRIAPVISERTTVDAVAQAREGGAPQWGANASRLIGDSVIAYVEWSGARRARSAPAGFIAPDAGNPGAIDGSAASAATRDFDADDPAAPRAWANRWVAGASWTTPWEVQLTVERWHAGDAPDAADWRAIRAALPGGGTGNGAAGASATAASYANWRGQLAERGDPVVRENWFLRAAWDRALGRADLDLSAFARINAYDRSRFWQAEAAWHATPHETLRLVASGTAGAAGTEFGASATRAALFGYVQIWF